MSTKTGISPFLDGPRSELRPQSITLSDGSEARIWLDGTMVCLSIGSLPDDSDVILRSTDACLIGMGLQEASRIAAQVRVRNDEREVYRAKKQQAKEQP